MHLQAVVFSYARKYGLTAGATEFIRADKTGKPAGIDTANKPLPEITAGATPAEGPWL